MIGSELRAIRSRLGLTQESLAQHLGVTANTIARWERDEVSIPPHLALALEALETRLSKNNRT